MPCVTSPGKHGTLPESRSHCFFNSRDGGGGREACPWILPPEAAASVCLMAGLFLLSSVFKLQ